MVEFSRLCHNAALFQPFKDLSSDYSAAGGRQRNVFPMLTLYARLPVPLQQQPSGAAQRAGAQQASRGRGAGASSSGGGARGVGIFFI